MEFIFEQDEEYDRQELLNFVGSKQIQSGIIWGNKEPGCIIVTSGGKHSDSAGYSDKENADGTWDYIGQGSIGDQSVDNFANTLLINKTRDVLLFVTREPSSKEQRQKGNRRKRYKFKGIYQVLSHSFNSPKEGKRVEDKLLIFRLVPATNIYESNPDSRGLKTPTSLSDLKKKIIDDEKKTGGGKPLSVSEYRSRSADVKSYALLRANGVCELCGKDAPFIFNSNCPFLEVHHILRLADDGPDLPSNVSAICPNCHKEAHYGQRKLEIRYKLVNLIFQKELSIS
jgi:5-methylcytosine-specific restriction protein A